MNLPVQVFMFAATLTGVNLPIKFPVWDFPRIIGGAGAVSPVDSGSRPALCGQE